MEEREEPEHLYFSPRDNLIDTLPPFKDKKRYKNDKLKIVLPLKLRYKSAKGDKIEEIPLEDLSTKSLEEASRELYKRLNPIRSILRRKY